jgi:hypothetical protein
MRAALADSPAVRSDALLIDQLARATRELRVREAEGRRTEGVRAVIRSLRETLSRGGVIDSDFLLKRSAEGEIELWHRGRRTPICTRVLRDAFETAGVDLEPGQVLLAERELARRAIEESLVRYSLQEFRLREVKASLLRATQEL